MSGVDRAASIQACAMRITRLAADGTTPAGSSGLIVTDRLIKLEAKKVFDSGDDFTVKNACGGITAAYKDGDKFKRYDFTMTYGDPDPEVGEMLTGGTLLLDSSGMSIGLADPPVGFGTNNGVCLELWSKAWIRGGRPPGRVFTDGVTTSASTSVSSASAGFTSTDVGRSISGTGIPSASTIISVTNSTTVVISDPATATGSGISVTLGRPGAYFHWLFPLTTWRGTDDTLENAAKQQMFVGESYENPNIGNGPMNDWPAGIVPTAGRSKSYWREDFLPDTSIFGYQATPAQV